MTPEEVSETMRRCPQESIDAAIQFQTDRDPALAPVVVMGIIERFAEPHMREKVRNADDQTRLFDDLGIDSLMMVEIVMTIEQVMQVSAPDEELRTLRTMGDVKKYMDAKIRGIPFVAPKPPVVLAHDAVASALPMTAPFLFIESARIEGDGASAVFAAKAAEPIYAGHFRDEPVLPASILMEAVGQLACLYVLKSGRAEFETAAGKAWFSSADGIRCSRLCRPGDVLTLEVKLLRAHPPLATFSGSVLCEGAKAASIGELTLACGPLPAAAAEPAKA
ncbi:MAG TPA: phosphopantetheine-binding protein [Opitutales bacterium]|nr:phosphopantetheine-binding protein [Opitutales bacterium]